MMSIPSTVQPIQTFQIFDENDDEEETHVQADYSLTVEMPSVDHEDSMNSCECESRRMRFHPSAHSDKDCTTLEDSMVFDNLGRPVFQYQQSELSTTTFHRLSSEDGGADGTEQMMNGIEMMLTMNDDDDDDDFNNDRDDDGMYEWLLDRLDVSDLIKQQIASKTSFDSTQQDGVISIDVMTPQASQADTKTSLIGVERQQEQQQEQHESLVEGDGENTIAESVVESESSDKDACQPNEYLIVKLKDKLEEIFHFAQQTRGFFVTLSEELSKISVKLISRKMRRVRQSNRNQGAFPVLVNQYRALYTRRENAFRYLVEACARMKSLQSSPCWLKYIGHSLVDGTEILQVLCSGPWRGELLSHATKSTADQSLSTFLRHHDPSLQQQQQNVKEQLKTDEEEVEQQSTHKSNRGQKASRKRRSSTTNTVNR